MSRYKKNLLTQNAKMKQTSKATGLKTMDFALRAVLDCPYAGVCKQYCYDKKADIRYPNVRPKRDYNKQATLRNSFTYRMRNEIIDSAADVVRVHSGGDFYSAEYVKKWWEIANSLPDVQFYAYTKSLPLFKFNKTGYTKLFLDMPCNFTLIFSFGGKHDDLINKDIDRHAIVYEKELPDGYSYANSNDHVALARNHRIALKKH